MLRLAVPSVGAILALALWVYCIFDVIATEELLIRNLRKPLWLLIVIFIPTIGALAWLLLGRPPYAGFLSGDTTARRPVRPVRGPDDDPGFHDHLRRMAERERPREDDTDDGTGFTFRW